MWTSSFTKKSAVTDLRGDLRAIAHDAEALLEATADATGDRVQEARERAEKTLRAARKRLNDSDWTGRARDLARTTNKYVRENSWGAVGTAAGTALLIGLTVGLIF